MSYHLKSGECVYVSKTSHVHENTKVYLEDALRQIDSHERKKIGEIIQFPQIIGKNNCVRTKKGEEIVYAKRRGRDFYSRFVKGREETDCDSMVIVLEKNPTKGNAYFLITSYIGNHYISFDRDTEDEYLGRASRKIRNHFWQNHALVWGSHDIEVDTIFSEKDYIRGKHKEKEKEKEKTPTNFLGHLKSGEVVISSKKSYIEAGTEAYLTEAIAKVENENFDWILMTFNMGRIIGREYLVKTKDNDDTFFAKSIHNKKYHRWVKGKEAPLSSLLSIYLLRDKENTSQYILIASYLGGKRRVEPWNNSKEKIKENDIAFWETHAYVEGYEEIIPESIKKTI